MKLSTFLLLLASVLWTVFLSAAQEFQPISPAELEMTSEPLAPGAPAIILERRVDRDDRDWIMAHEDNYLRIKILTEEGRKYANVEIPLIFERVDNIVDLKARTIGPTGAITNFDGSVYVKDVVKGRHIKIRVKAFTLPNVQAGSIIEYSFTAKLRGIYDSHWVLNTDLFTKRAQFSLRPFAYSYRPMRLHWIWKGVPKGVEPHEGPDHVIRLEMLNIPAFQEEDFMPPENELKARVDFLYEDRSAPSEPEKFWKSAGKTWNDALESFLRKHKAVQEAAPSMFSPNDPPEEKLRKIYARVQALRNVSYEPEKTEKQEKRNKEKPAENVDEVWKHGFGNAVDLTWLYLSLARASGFEAYGCWLASRSVYFFNPKFMQSERLGANVVLVKLSNKEIYLDPGTPFTPFGLLPWNETATPGLRLDQNGGTWIKTPLPDSAASQMRRSARFKLSENGDLEGKLTMTFTGLEGMYQRLDARNEDETYRKQYLEELVKAQVPSASEVELTNKPDWNNPAIPLEAELSVKIPNWASPTGRRLLVPVGVFAKSERGMFKQARRIHPIYFSYPYSERDDVTIEPPPEWQTLPMPQAQTHKANKLLYSINVEDTPGVLHVTRQLNIDIYLLEQSEYSDLRNFFQSVRSSDEQQIVLQPLQFASKQLGSGPRQKSNVRNAVKLSTFLLLLASVLWTASLSAAQEFQPISQPDRR